MSEPIHTRAPMITPDDFVSDIARAPEEFDFRRAEPDPDREAPSRTTLLRKGARKPSQPTAQFACATRQGPGVPLIEIESKPAMAYASYALTDLDPDGFRERMVKRGAGYGGWPVKLTNGKVVGKVLSAAASPFPIQAEDGETYVGAPLVEVQWNSADMLPLAKQAELDLDDAEGCAVLFADDAGDLPNASFEKSREAGLSAELRSGWGFA